MIRLPKPARLVMWHNIDGADENQEFFWQLLTHKIKGFERIGAHGQQKSRRSEPLVISGLTPGEYQVARYRMVNLKHIGFGKMLDRQTIVIKPGERKVIRFLRPDGLQVEGKVLGLKDAGLSQVMLTITPHSPSKEPKPRFDQDIADVVAYCRQEFP